MNKQQREKWADKLFDMGAYTIGISLFGGFFYSPPSKENVGAAIVIAIIMVFFAMFCFSIGHFLLPKEKDKCQPN